MIASIVRRASTLFRCGRGRNKCRSVIASGAKGLVAADQEILHHGEVRKQFGVLKCSANAEFDHLPQRSSGNRLAVEKICPSRGW